MNLLGSHKDDAPGIVISGYTAVRNSLLKGGYL